MLRARTRDPYDRSIARLTILLPFIGSLVIGSLVIGLLAPAAQAKAARAWPAPFVALTQVPVSLDDVVVLDARGRKAFAGGHLPGAVRIDWLDYRDGLLRTGRLPADMDKLAARLGTLGVDDGKRVLVCGAARAGWGEEGRIAWMLRYLGHRAVAVLDGGCLAWRAAGRAWTRDSTRPAPGRFHASPDASFRARKNEVRRALATGEAQVIDVRRREEFDGATPHFSARGGHIPGARHLWFKDLLDDKGRVLDKEGVRARLVSAGLDPDRPVITYCTGGVRSAMAAEVLRSAGIAVRNYDGSWWEWSGDDKLPVEKRAPQ